MKTGVFVKEQLGGLRPIPDLVVTYYGSSGTFSDAVSELEGAGQTSTLAPDPRSHLNHVHHHVHGDNQIRPCYVRESGP